MGHSESRDSDGQSPKGLELSVEADATVHKVLILGTSQSSKSTVFKQVLRFYGRGYTAEDRKTYKEIVWRNIMEYIKVLCLHAIETPDALSPELLKLATKWSAIRDNEEELTPELGEELQQLWSSPVIRAAECTPAQYIPQSRSYLERYVQQPPSTAATAATAGSQSQSRLHQIANPEYVPTDFDVVSSRVRTTGIVESAYEYQNRSFQLFDVGGCRNERKKWIHCFEETVAIVFTVGLGLFDRNIFEDETSNHMTEALTLWEETVNGRWFRDTQFYLLFTSHDLFTAKIESGIPLTIAFPDYKGSTVEEALTYVEGQFLAVDRRSSNEDSDLKRKRLSVHLNRILGIPPLVAIIVDYLPISDVVVKFVNVVADESLRPALDDVHAQIVSRHRARRKYNAGGVT